MQRSYGVILVSDVTHITVLVADDHPLVRETVRTLLAEMGITVIGEAVDGIEANELAAELHPRVAILDVAMPRMGGLEAAKRIRRTEPETRLIMLSVYDEPQCIARAEQAGACAYVVKRRLATDLVPAVHAACAA
ncbi:MAG TPA: response regulator transcription factor [Chloroflexota bacterium]|nr:response regulator transcription factor [Chloroflexota bacterium]